MRVWAERRSDDLLLVPADPHLHSSWLFVEPGGGQALLSAGCCGNHAHTLQRASVTLDERYPADGKTQTLRLRLLLSGGTWSTLVFAPVKEALQPFFIKLLMTSFFSAFD